MKKFLIASIFLILSSISRAQKPATIKEYNKVFPTYPFSDPNPIPVMEKIYPYYRYDGFANKAVSKEWKVVELENDYITVMILPEVGGKIWSAIEKSTGRSFIYYNHTVKFRDVAMRGPWTSGGIEANYGIIGHTPNCATPVDYMTMKKEDGSVSCIIGVLDLLTRTSWRLEINLPTDKAYLTTSSFWYNSTPFEQPYYTWMNTGIKAKGNLQFIYPGTHYLGHSGEFSDWPINKENGKDISFYENNDFGGPKSYHVFGKYTDFFGAYWHDDDFGMGRYSTHDDKAGKKIWIWGLSEQGMIWEDLLTDTDGQYVEVQSGRLFNQADVGSSATPFKHPGFQPYRSDAWTEYWFPVKQTKGFVKANNMGSLNIKKENGFLKIYFCPLQNINDEFKVMDGEKLIYSKILRLNPLQNFADSLRLTDATDTFVATLGGDKLIYEASPAAQVLERPLESPKDFDWNSAFGLYTKGREQITQRFYDKAAESLEACLAKDPNFVPALTDMAMLMCRNMRYADAYSYARRALSVDTYDPAANYYYGLANVQSGNIVNAMDGFDIAALNIGYRSAAYTELSKIYFRDGNHEKALDYAVKSLQFNQQNLEAEQIMAVIARLQKDIRRCQDILQGINTVDPLNHFVRFEKFMLENTDAAKKEFVGLIRNELPHETFLELAAWYRQLARNEESEIILSMAPQTPEVLYWRAFLNKDQAGGTAIYEKARAASPLLSFPFRVETVPILQWAIGKNNDWKARYYLGLIYWHTNNLSQAKELFRSCGSEPDYAPFYAARAVLLGDSTDQATDLEYAIKLDKKQWRFHKLLAEYKIHQKKYDEAVSIAGNYYKQDPGNYIIGMLYAKSLLFAKRYKESDALLTKLKIIPFEGATEGRELYREAKLMQAVREIQNKKYKNALAFVNASKLWPLNLGVGKPYENDIDLRLEDWITYLSYSKMGNSKQAEASLKNILQKQTSPGHATDLVTALAIAESNSKEEAVKWLDRSIEQHPDKKILLWSKALLMGEPADPSSVRDNDVTARILEQVVALK